MAASRAVQPFSRHSLVTDALAGPERRPVATTGAGAFHCGPQVSVSFVSLGWLDDGGALENQFVLSAIGEKDECVSAIASARRKKLPAIYEFQSDPR